MYNQGFTNIFASVVTLIGTFVVMVQIDWQLTLLSLGVVPLIVGAIYYFAQRIRRQSTRDPGTRQRVARPGAGGLELGPHGARVWPRRLGSASIPADRRDQSLRANLELTLTNVNSALVISHADGSRHRGHVLHRHAARPRRHALARLAPRLQRVSRDAVSAARIAHLHDVGDGRRDRRRAALLRGARSRG